MMKRNLIGEDVLLHKSTAPSIGEDGRVYACIGRNVYAFDTDGTVSWNAALNDTCEELLSPVVTTDGKVYVAANCRVIAVTYSQDLDLLSAWDLYNGTSLDGSMLGSKHITGLALIGNGTSLLINAGAAGLYAVSEDGSPLWSTNGDFKSKDIAFPPEIFCSEQDKICYFHFSPAVDDCDGSIYLNVMADSAYKRMVICNRWMGSICKVALQYTKFRKHISCRCNCGTQWESLCCNHNRSTFLVGYNNRTVNMEGQHRPFNKSDLFPQARCKRPCHIGLSGWLSLCCFPRWSKD
ncbi:hypothetical protein KP509_23G073600 [Ceratopteris richardii]|nr:hypothetical protein KP509_23G073600 [Ceratopteris richardii]